VGKKVLFSGTCPSGVMGGPRPRKGRRTGNKTREEGSSLPGGKKVIKGKRRFSANSNYFEKDYEKNKEV